MGKIAPLAGGKRQFHRSGRRRRIRFLGPGAFRRAVFALRAPGMVERGPDVTAFRIPDDKMLSQRDLNYDLDPDEVTSALLDVFPRKIEQGEESFDVDDSDRESELGPDDFDSDDFSSDDFGSDDFGSDDFDF